MVTDNRSSTPMRCAGRFAEGSGACGRCATAGVVSARQRAGRFIAKSLMRIRFNPKPYGMYVPGRRALSQRGVARSGGILLPKSIPFSTATRSVPFRDVHEISRKSRSRIIDEQSLGPAFAVAVVDPGVGRVQNWRPMLQIVGIAR